MRGLLRGLRRPFARPPAGPSPAVRQQRATFNQWLRDRGQEPLTDAEFDECDWEMARDAWNKAHAAEINAAMRRMGREPVYPEGADVQGIKGQLNKIEDDYQNALRAGESELARLVELGIQVPATARQKIHDQAAAKRDAEIREVRQTFDVLVDEVRAGYGPLRHQARMNATPEIPAGTANRMETLLGQCRGLADVQRLHRDALQARDEAGAYWLEKNAGQMLLNQPNRTELMNRADVEMWASSARAEATRRAGQPLAELRASEAAIAESLDELNAHATSDEARNFAARNKFQDADQFLQAGGIARLRLNPAEPVLD